MSRLHHGAITLLVYGVKLGCHQRKPPQLKFQVVCRRCGQSVQTKGAGRQSLRDYRTHREDWRGRTMIGTLCVDCKNASQREGRKRNSNRIQKRYEKTVNGILIRRHQKVLPWWDIDRLSFVAWAKSDKEFLSLYTKYRDSGFDWNIAPTVLILDERLPASTQNCVWVPYSIKRSIIGAESRAGKTADPIHRRRRTP